MKDRIREAIDEGMEVLKDTTGYNFSGEYKKKVNESIQLLLKALHLLEAD
jgi:hypothetical protein